MARLDLGGAASGVAGGAATGGSMFGAPGAVAGGLFGGLAGLFGKKKKTKKRSTLDKRQQQINQQQQQGILGQGPLADLYNYNPEKANEVFEKTIANPAYRNFQEKVVPEITGQFRSQGLMRSSYAGDALAKEGRNVQESLDAQRANYLYGQESEARGAKRNAVENYQNRTTFDNVTEDPSGIDIQGILKSIPPEAADKLMQWLQKQKGI